MEKPFRGSTEEEKCPTDDFTIGEPKGTCWGDGHYDCKNCIHYRKDFKIRGQDYIDYIHELNRGIIITVMKKDDIYI